jgi:hypothetical protein
MPAEIRHIIFSQEELVDALARHFSSRPTLLPGAEIVACKFGTDPEVGSITCSVFIRADESCEEEEKKLEPSLVAAAMLAYCITKRIPIAKKSSKGLRIMNGDLALSLILHDKHVWNKAYVC